MRHAQLIKPPQPCALFSPQREMQILAQIPRRQLASISQPSAPRAPQSLPTAARPDRAPPPTTSATSATSTSARATHIANTNGSPVHSTPLLAQVPNLDESRLRLLARSLARSSLLRLAIARSPINSTASASVVSSPHPIGSGSHCGRTPHSSASRICVSAALVRDPSSSATRRTSLRRHAKMQLHAQHRPAARHARVRNDRDSPAVRKNSTDGTSATSSRPAASESASRLGKSYVSRTSGAAPSKPYTKRLAVQIIDGADSHRIAL